MGLEENKNVIGKYLDDIKIELGCKIMRRE